MRLYGSVGAGGLLPPSSPPSGVPEDAAARRSLQGEPPGMRPLPCRGSQPRWGSDAALQVAATPPTPPKGEAERAGRRAPKIYTRLINVKCSLQTGVTSTSLYNIHRHTIIDTPQYRFVQLWVLWAAIGNSGLFFCPFSYFFPPLLLFKWIKMVTGEAMPPPNPPPLPPPSLPPPP